MEHLLPADYRVFVAEVGYPVVGFRYYVLGRSRHRDVAVDRSYDAVAERLRVDEDDQVELEALRQFWRQRPHAGRRPECGIADDAGDPVGVRGALYGESGEVLVPFPFIVRGGRTTSSRNGRAPPSAVPSAQKLGGARQSCVAR